MLVGANMFELSNENVFDKKQLFGPYVYTNCQKLISLSFY